MLLWLFCDNSEHYIGTQGIIVDLEKIGASFDCIVSRVTPQTPIFLLLYLVLNSNVLIFICITFPDKNERGQ